MSDEMRTQLTDFATEFMSEAQAEQRLREVFEKYMEVARVAKNAGNYEQMVESYIRASAAATFLE
jgi:predicted component of type VI protein secretion system